jgi:hypothetical protein
MKEEYIEENPCAEPINYFPKLFFILWPMCHTKMACESNNIFLMFHNAKVTGYRFKKAPLPT